MGSELEQRSCECKWLEKEAERSISNVYADLFPDQYGGELSHEVVPFLNALDGPNLDFQLAPDFSSMVVSASGADCLELWNLETGISDGAIPLTNSIARGRIYDTAFSANGHIAVASAGGGLELFDKGDEIRFLGANQGEAGHEFTKLTFAPDGALLAAASANHSINIFSTEGPPARLALKCSLKSPALSMGFSPDGKSLVTAGAGKINVWSIGPGGERAEMHFQATAMGVVKEVGFCQEGEIIVVLSTTGVKLWIWKDGKEIIPDAGLNLAMNYFLNFAPGEGKSTAIMKSFFPVAICGLHGKLCFKKAAGGIAIYDLNTMESVELEVSLRSVKKLAFSRDGSILGVSNVGRILFFDVLSGKLRTTLYVSKDSTFLWTTPPSPAATCGWFWTNAEKWRPVVVYETKADGAKQTLTESDPRYRLHWKAYHNPKEVLNSLHGRKSLFSALSTISGSRNPSVNLQSAGILLK